MNNRAFINISLISLSFLLSLSLVNYLAKKDKPVKKSQLALAQSGVCEYVKWPSAEVGAIPISYDTTGPVLVTSSGIYVDRRKVGIGTRNPQYELDVFGTARVSTLCLGADCRSVWPSGGGGGSGTNYWTLSGTSLYPNDPAYSVGIGTNDSNLIRDRKLTVVGSASISQIGTNHILISPVDESDTRGILFKATDTSLKIFRPTSSEFAGWTILANNENLRRKGIGFSLIPRQVDFSIVRYIIDQEIAGNLNRILGAQILRPTMNQPPQIREEVRVGIGTNNPQEKLDIFGGNVRVNFNSLIIREPWSYPLGIGIKTGPTWNGWARQIAFLGPNNERLGAIIARGPNSTTLDFIAIGRGIGYDTSTNWAAPNTEYDNFLTIRSNGNVGIGTNNPQERLDVNGNVRITNNNLILHEPSSYPYGIVMKTARNWGGWARQLAFVGPDNQRLGGIVFQGDSPTSLNFIAIGRGIATSGTGEFDNFLTIRSNGNVGIGTNNPAERLTVVGDILALSPRGWNQDGERVKVSIGDGFNYISVTRGEGLSLGTWGKIVFRDHTGENEPGRGKDLMVINSNGNVGIGTNNPKSNLHIFSPQQEEVSFQVAGTESLRIRNLIGYFKDEGPYHDAVIIEKTDDDPTVEGGIVFGFATSSKYDVSIDSPDWAKGFYSVMTIRGTGNVGIGTEKPQWKLEVKGMVNASDDGLSTKVVDGPVSDQNFRGKVHDGLIGIDSKNGRIYFRASDKWHYVSKTGGFQVPSEERQGIEIGDFVVGQIDGEMSDGALHGVWKTLKEALGRLGILIKNSVISIKNLMVERLVVDQICSSQGKCVEVSDELIEKLKESSKGGSIIINNLSQISSESQVSSEEARGNLIKNEEVNTSTDVEANDSQPTNEN
ncbi:MAG: hypothetical protein NZ822_01105 [Patescibacteria group bacterium]|nr:hypothetical protein [Patescibacteria group bacterium]